MDFKSVVKDVLKRIFVGGDQDSKPYSFNLKDLWHSVKMGLLGALAVAAPVLIHAVDAHNFGIADVVVGGLLASLLAAVQSFVDDRRKKLDEEK